MISNEIRALFAECFPDTVNEADIILGFAEKHGRIYEKRINGVLANIICTSPIYDNDFYAEYIFACGTKRALRGQGIFKSHLDEIIGSKLAILIPENESLFAMYGHFGFEPLYCIEAYFGASVNELPEADRGSALNAYRTACAFPKKSPKMLEATLDAFISYGNTLKRQENAIILMQGETASEIFAPDEESLLRAAKACKSALLPQSMAKTLDELGIKYEKKKFAAAKNLPADAARTIYINNLFN